MRVAKIFILFIFCWFLWCCSGDTPTSPSKPYDTYSIPLSIYLNNTYTNTEIRTFDVHISPNNTWLCTLNIPSGESAVIETVWIDFQLPKTEREATYFLRWTFTKTTATADWCANSSFRYGVIFGPFPPGTRITIEATPSCLTTYPCAQVGYFTGWKVGETKEISFKIRKV